MHLVIPDAHVEAGQDLSRFDHLGKFIVKEQPDVIISLGDFCTMNSISHWDLNKKLKMEGRRYTNDTNSAADALRRLFTPLAILQDYQRRNKAKLYKPKLVWVDGNHEEWVQKYIEQSPEMEGHINLHRDIGLYDYMSLFSVVHSIPYRHGYKTDGIVYTHTPIARNGQAISGVYAIKRALELYGSSVIFAHTHTLRCMTDTRHGSQQTMALCCGCFFEHDFDYVEGAPTDYWRGVTIVNPRGNGKFDFQTISLSTLREEY